MAEDFDSMSFGSESSVEDSFLDPSLFQSFTDDPPVPDTDAGEFLRQLQQLFRPRSPPPLQKYLRAHPNDVGEHVRREEELRRIVLQATENGYVDTVRKALPVLARMLERQRLLPSLPSLTAAKFKTLLDFYEGKGGILVPQRDGKPGKRKEFYTPLLHACEAKGEGGHDVEMVELLLDKGARPGYVGGHFVRRGHGKQTGTGLSAMHVACIQGREDVVRLLIARAQDNLLKKSLKEILNAKTLKDKWTPLMYAVREGHVEVVQLLLEYELLDVLATNAKGQTVLHIAGSHNQVECLQEIHKKLEATSMQKVAQVEDNPFLKTDKIGYNVLQRVCSGPKDSGPKSSVKTLQWLFEAMPHLKSPDILMLGGKTKGYTMLLLACENGNRDMVEYLLQLEGGRVDVSACTEDGKTGLHLAAIHDYPDVAELLIEHGVSLIAQDKERQAMDSETAVGGDTALHIAVRKSSLDVEEKIRSSEGAGEVLGIPNKAGKIPAHVRPEQTIPLEIVRMGEAVVQRYRLALRKGKKKKMPRCNLIALGEQRVGKTSLLSLLMGKEFIEDRDSTRGIDNEHVDIVVESHTVSSEHWKQVESKDLARGHEKQFVDSVAEEFRPHFRNEGKGGSVPPPTAEILEGKIGEIEQYLDFIEEEAKKPSPPPPERVPIPVKEPVSGVLEKSQSALNFNAPLLSKPKASELPEERKPQKPPTVSTKPKPQAPPPVNPQPPRQPPLTLPPRPAVEQLPKKRNESNRRGSNISRRLGKSIVSTAKQGSREKEPVLQYNTLDFAGQKHYRAMHHCFIVRRAIYLVVFNLQTVREALDAPSEENKKALEEIQYWLNSIHAHIHKIGPEPHLKRVVMVGTHRAPEGKREITEDDMRRINDALGERYIDGSDIVNDLRRADPNAEVWFAAVENSIDQPEESARQKSGAHSVQKAIHQAWDDLPFKTEEYPTTWLRFEAFLNRKRDTAIMKVDTVRQEARDYGIGEDDEKEIDIALGFFHDTGTIVYLKKLPTLYLSEEEKKVLDDLVLLDPTWLTTVMRTVMELKTGTGPLKNDEVQELQKTATADANLLRKCWEKFTNKVFRQLCLMLQSFCLIFPLPQCESLPPERSLSMPASSQASSQSAERGSATQQINRSESEGQPPSNPVTTYLIPSMLPEKPRPTDESLKKLYNFSFSFNFRGFLPVEVYHRLLCLMMRDQKHKALKSRREFTSDFFQINCVHKCNWMVQMMDSKLKVSVICPHDKVPPSTYVALIHNEYLQKIICDEQASSLQGLKYIGGPEHTCECGRWKGVVPYVTYPERDMEVPSVDWNCEDCLHPFNIDLLLDPKFKEKEIQPNMASRSDGPLRGECETEENGAIARAAGNTVNIQADHVVIAELGSTIHFQPHSSGGLEIPMAELMLGNDADGPHISTPQQIATPTQQRAAIPSPAVSTTPQHDHCITLGIGNLHEVLGAVVDVKQKWIRLGLALGLRYPTLEGIKTNCDVDDSKLEMLVKWLKKTDECEPSWNVLVEALKQPTVEHYAIAEAIKKKYLAN